MIQINDKVRIRKIDKLNLVVEEYRAIVNRKTNQECWEWAWCGYYGDLRSALGGAIKHCEMLLAEQEIKSLQELMTKLDEIDSDAKNAVKGIKLWGGDDET